MKNTNHIPMCAAFGGARPAQYVVMKHISTLSVVAGLLLAFFWNNGALQAQSCNCKEYIYLNEPILSTVLKFEVGAPILLTEVTGANGGPHWYPGAGMSELPEPHGLATDLNGRLYIGSVPNTPTTLRKFNCDGVISPVSGNTIIDTESGVFNMFSIGNIIYKSGGISTDGNFYISAFNSCTGALVGQKCLTGGNGRFNWGLSYNEATGTVYATQSQGTVWKLTISELNDFATCKNPLISKGPNLIVNPGENYLPNDNSVFGIVGDNSGNIYIVKSSYEDFDATPSTYLLKYNSAGQFISQSLPSPVNGPYGVSVGIIWSEATNRLYVSNYTDLATADCISAFDANTLAYLGTAAPNPNLPSNNTAKALAIIKECCPVNLEQNFTKNVCGLPGQKFYLNSEAFNTCGGVVCGSSWTPTSLTGMTFDPCDNSVNVTGSGCGVFTLNIGAVSSTGCGPQSATFTICNTLPPSITNASPATQTLCEGSPGADLTVQTDQNAANNIRFVRFNSDQMAGATPTAAEAGVIYAGGTTIATVTPTGAGPTYTATLTAAAAGWNSLAPGTYYVYAVYNSNAGAVCSPVPVQEFVVTITDKPDVSANSLTVCESGPGAGASVNLVGLVQNPDGATLSFSEGANPIANPNAAALSVGAHTITVVAASPSLPGCTTTTTFVVTVDVFPTAQPYCTGETYTLTAPAGLSNIVWYRNGVEVAQGNPYTVTQPGNYTYQARDAGGCTVGSCCPAVFNAGPCYDYGDLPSTLYNTTLAQSGPSHIIVPGLKIGAALDYEYNGQPNSLATGDGNDEDGVTFPPLYAGQSANITINVMNTTGNAAAVFAFIDWNKDGDFADVGETATVSAPNGTNGPLTLVFSIPANAVKGMLLGARFRLSTDAALGPDGPATNGEVEDYLVQLCDVNAVIVSQQNVTCFGGSNGSVDLTVTGAVLPVTYDWSNDGPESPDDDIADVTGLTAGTYTVTVTDANGCTGTTSVTITQPPALVLTTVPTNATCGASNGAINLTVTGGTGAYTYDWSNDGPENPDNDPKDLSGLSAGVYVVTVTDAAGCTAVATAIVNNIGGPTLSVTGTNISCFGGTNGTTTLTVTGGTSPYTYDWSNDGPETPDNDTKDLTGLSAGTYTVTVTDVNGCMAMVMITLTQPTALSLSTTQVNIACNGGSNGSVDLTVGGGTLPYTYDWSNDGPENPDNDPQDLAGLTAGTYTVTVTDANLCTATTSVTITQPAVLVATLVSQVNVTCNGGTNGSVDLTVTGGTTPYTYDWSNDGPENPDDDIADVTGLTAGTYTVTVTDANQCTATTSVTITQPSAIVATAAAVNATCGNANGSINLTVTGGTGAYTYDWSNDGAENPDNDPEDISGLSAGIYTVTVTDANGCTASISVTVNNVNGPTLSATTVNVSCFGGANGSVNLTVAGGTTPYTYDWSNDGPENPDNDPEDLSGLTAGTYTVTVTDANLCTALLSVTLTQPTALNLTTTQVNISCNGGSNGSADLTVSGGVSPYTYDWSNDGPETPDNDPQDLTGLTAGTYTVTVTDLNGCSATTSVTLTQPAVLVSTVVSQVNVTCFGGTNGSVDLTVTGGTLPYTYDWSNDGPENPDDDIADVTGLAAGTYTVTVTDANQCTATTSVTITQPTAIVLSINPTNILCFGNASGAADLTVTGGTGAYTYDWSNDGPENPDNDPQDLTGLTAGTYTVTVTDANGCTALAQTTLTQPAAAISLSVRPSNVTCFGASNGSINLSAAGGTGTLTFDWSNDGPENPDNDPEDLTGLGAGTYTVTVTDANGCTATISATITEPAALSLVTTQVNVSCNGGANGSIGLTASGGTGTYTYDWSNDGAETPDDDNADISGLTAGTYTVTVTDVNGCTATTSVTISQPTAISLTAVPTSATCGNANGSINLTVSGGVSPYTYDWSNDGPENPDNDPEDLSGLSADVYTVTVTDANGCTAVTQVMLNNINGPTLSATQTNVTCFGGANGAIDLSVTGGTSPYTYDWSNDGPENPDNDPQDLTVLTAGTYTVTVTDANGCMAMLMATITQPTVILPELISVTNEGLCGDADGAINITVSGGVGPYTYDWSNDGPENPDNDPQDLSGLSAGTYTVTITDAAGCPMTTSATVTCVQAAEIGNYTWIDANANGLQDMGELPLPGVTVVLEGTDINGNLVNLTTVTDASGLYLFTHLWPGTYKLTFVSPGGGYVGTFANVNANGNDATDSDANPATGGMTVNEILTPGESNLTYDAGFYIPASIGNFVWVDQDGDGIQDSGEPGIGGVLVTLTGTDGQGNPVTQTTTTNPDGSYNFTNLVPGTYKLTFATPAGGYVTTPANVNANGNDATDNDADPTMGGMTANEVLTSGENNTTYDAGYYLPASIGNYTWIDANANGIQDGGELPIGGVQVTLTGTTGSGQAINLTQTTNASGLYLFPNLQPGTYKLTFGTPAGGYVPTTANDVDDPSDAADSDADPSMGGMTVNEVLVSGENNLTYDAGYYIPASIGNYTWIDTNGNGVQDGGEPPLGGVLVTLTGTDGQGNPVSLTQTTLPDGSYNFTNLVPGTYKLTFATPAGGYVNTNANVGNDASDSDADPLMGGMTVNEVLTSGENNTTYDAGFYIPASIGNYTWIDANANGIQDPGESPLPGVVVVLTGTTGSGQSINLTATTDANGLYLFSNLQPGTYKLTFQTPVGGYVSTTANDPDATDANDSDADPGMGGMTVNEVLTSGENNLTYDAGYYQPASIGNFVWVDQDGDGIQDSGEPGIGGVLVTLTGTDGQGNPVTQTTTTNPDGSYNFTNLVPGTYKLTFATPAGGYVTTPANVNANGNDTTDSDADPTMGGMTATETLTSGENNTTYDAGYYIPASIGNYTWIDANANGTQDGGELPIGGVQVTLTGTTGSGQAINLTQTTNASGLYLFSNLQPGTYKLTFGTPAGGYVRTTANDVDDPTDAADSDADPGMGGMTVNEVLVSGENNLSYDAGYYIPASIGNYTWIDTNGNGVQDGGEPPLGGVLVTLTGTDGQGNPVSLTQTTLPDGSYNFTNLVPGTYKLTFTTPAGGYVNTNANVGNDASDSDADPLMGGMTINEVLTSGENNTTYDAGFYIPASIGNYTWIDANANGIQDGGESPLPGVVVVLTGTTGSGQSINLTATTDANGLYLFSNLQPGTYKLTFQTPVGGYVSTTANDPDATDANDSDADPSMGGMTVNEVLTSGENNLTYDAGYYQPASIGNFVWVDQDGDGIQDSGEPGIGGVLVTLTGTDGQGNPVTQTTTTNPDGSYNFTNLVPGTYKLTFATPAGGYVTTPANVNANGNDATDSDADPTMGGMTVNEVLTSGENNTTYDAGYYIPASIGNYTWIDANANGIQDGGELPIGGVQVTLTGTTGSGQAINLTQTTNASGLYLFSNLQPGTYKLTFGIPAGGYVRTTANDVDDPTDAADSDADPGMGGMTVNEVLVSGENNLSYDAGYYIPASIGNYTWIDTNGNGVQDGGEPPLGGVQVTLTGTDGQGNPVSLTQTTLPDGSYNFTNLVPGTYKLTFATPAGGYVNTNANVGNDIADSDADPAMGGMTVNEVLTSGENNTTYDAGYYQPASIGNYTWIDANANGIQDGGESPLPGVVVVLTGTTGSGQSINLTATTDANGLYLFSNLQPGTYKLTFQTPVGGYVSTTANDPDATDANDSDADPTMSGMTVNEVLTSGENNLTYDAGYYQPASIGNFVWYDLDNDGDQDPGEPGLQGFTVTLTGTDGQGNPVTLTTTTDVNGQYLFTNLVPGSYKLTFTAPAGSPYVLSPLNQAGGDDTMDSDANPAMGGMTVFETLTSGENNLTYDAGYYVPNMSIGSTVFYDSNNNGTQDVSNPLETGIAGVTVNLYYDANNNGIIDGTETTALLTTTTNASGNYFFGNLSPGNYVVGIPTAPAGTSGSSTGQDGDTGTDGNDNGAPGALGIQSTLIVLTPNSEPVNEPGQGGMQDDAADTNGDMTIDFGFVPNMSIGSTVFADVNNNGVQNLTNPLEIGIAGVAVSLFYDANNNGIIDGGENTPIATTITNASGNYYFPNLIPGNYQVGVPVPDASAQVSSTGQNSTDNNDLSDDGAQSGAGNPTLSPIVNLFPGAEPTETAGNPGATQDDAAETNGNMTVDFGFVPTMSIGSTVFADVNNDGIQNTTNALEDGIAGVTVNLYFDANNDGVINGTEATTPVLTTTTDANGNYYFPNLPEGNYQVGILPPGSAPVSSTGTSGDNGVDGNDNGDQPGGTGAPILSGLINLNGGVETANEPNQGGTADDANDANGDMTIDFGLIPNQSIGSTVFFDMNNDGTQLGVNEIGIAGVTVQLLYDANNDGAINGAELVPVLTTATNASGNYFFGTLPSGNYQVVIPTTPQGAPLSSSTTAVTDNNVDGNDDGAQPGGIGTTVVSPIINLSNNAEPLDAAETAQGGTQDNTAANPDNNGNMTIDFGFVPAMSIGSTVFYDSNNNGTQDVSNPLETGIAGVTVNLYYDANNNGIIDGTETTALLTTTTNASGNYFFGNLSPGNYVVGIPTAPAGTSGSSTGQDIADAVDGNDNGAPGAFGIQSTIVNLSPNQEPANEPGQGGTQDDAFETNGNMTIDFGFVPNMSVGSTVFYDINNDGIQAGAGETGIPGITVQLLADQDADGVIELDEVVATDITDANGDYYFGNLPPGAYQIAIPTVPANAQNSSAGANTAAGVDGNDNGSQAGGYGTVVTSEVFTLVPGTEPVASETAQGGNQDAAADSNGDMTIDFGFFYCIPPQTFAITLKTCAIGQGMLMGNFDFAALHAAELVTTNTFNGPVPAGLTVTFHNSLEDANQDQNPLANIYNSQTGNIWVRVESNNDPACYSVDVIQLVVNPLPILLLNKTDETCSVSNDGTVSVVVTNTQGTYNYDWNNLAGVNNPAAQTGLNGGTYTVTVTDGNGCTSTGSVTVAEGPALTLAPIPNIGPLCPGQKTIQPTLLSATPVNPATVYTWTGGAGAGLPNGTTTGLNPVIPGFNATTVEGVYTVTVTATLGVLPNQCSSTTTFTITINDVTPPVFDNCPTSMVMIGNDPDQCSGKLNWSIPTATDECATFVGITQTGGPLSGSVISITCPPTPQTITYTADDGNGNTSTCTFQVMVVDTEKPEFDADILMPGDVTVSCDAVPTNCIPRTGGACLPLTVNDVNDNCTAPQNLVINFTEVSTQGANPALCSYYNYTLTRTWKVSDCAGNMLIHTQVIMVKDTKAPTAVCKNITVTLDKFGKATITPADINNGSFDNCAAPQYLTYSLSNGTFTCANVGVNNNVTITVTDPCGNASTCTGTVTVLQGPGLCTPQYTVSTSCMDNATTQDDGQFMDLITVKSLAMQTWTVTTNTGLYTNNSPAPPASPIQIPVGTAFTAGNADGIDNDNDGQTDEADEMIYYTLKGRFTECVGYNITIGNAGNFGMAPAATSATIANKACYPNVYFKNLSDPFCLNTPPFVIELADYNNATGSTINVMVDGVATNIFNAAALGSGPHTIMATFDAGGATTNLVINGVQVGGSMADALADPGCKQKLTKIVNVVTTPTTVVCNDLVYVSLDSTCMAIITGDDVLEGTYYCYDDYTVEIDKTLPYGNGPWVLGKVDASDIGKTYFYHVIHPISGNVCWGQIKIEDKLAPALTCPANITVACSESTGTAHTGNVVVKDCSATTTVIDDNIVDNGECGTPRQIITRTFIVTDAWGNQSTCAQTITVVPFDLSAVIFPADVTVNCESAYLNPNATNPDNTGRPSINGAPIGAGGLCSASISKTDEIFDICAGSYEIHRTWKISNTCFPLGAGNPIIHTQRIRVKDFGGPVFACPPAVTVSTDPYQCCATAALPDMIVSEGCSQITDLQAKVTGTNPANGNIITFTVPGHLGDFAGNNYWNPDTLAIFTYTQCLPLGVYTVQYTAADQCGNTSKCAFQMTVADLVPPLAACDQWTQVDLGGDGMALVNASTFDDGSHDNCAPVEFKVRRMQPNTCQSDSVFYDQVKFCCSDINDTIQVVFRVYDVDVPAGEIAREAYEGHYNDCMVQVLVKDKIKPTCNPPANVTVDCENFDPSLWAYGAATAEDNCCIDTITHSVNYSQFDTVCNRGTITRTFRAFDCGGLTSQCTQRVVVNYLQDYYVKFPNDAIVTTCDGTGIYGEPTFFGKDCELIGVSFEDQVFTVVPDACFEIERTWKIINWCTFNPNLPLISVPNPNPNATSNSPQNLPGPIVSAPGTAAPWTATVVKVLPTDATTTNYATFWTANANGYVYKQIIKIIDTQDPTVENCPDSLVTYCDVTPNDPLLWNASYWWDNLTGQHDLCEGPSDLTITATDACSGANINIHYLLFLDLDGDGTMESVVNSESTGIAGGLPWNTVFYSNANSPNFIGGTARAFDGRAVPNNQKYGFAIQTTVQGNKRVASVRWNTQQNQNTFVVPELPYGKHKIKWIIEDGCGNESFCEYNFEVKDCKKPTVVCLNGLSVNIMPTQMVTLWASDFLKYADDNCTPANQIKTGIRRSGTGTGFPLDGNGNPITSVNFTCDDLGTQLVELWGLDLAGNADYCETYVIVQDNAGNCINDPNAAKVAGTLATEANDGVEEGAVEITGSGNGIPTFNFTTMTTNQGTYNFNAIPKSSNSTVTPLKDDNPLNGVSTYDLVLISKHILGIEPLGSPYKMIAADANKSGSITTFDIVELRKLILGIYSDLPYNTSWRFVDKSFVFPNPLNPFQTQFSETKLISDIQSNHIAEDFVSVKVGDVNGTAIANSLMSADDRSMGTLLFDVNDRTVRAGETFTVALTPAQASQGYQFTLNTNGLDVLDIAGVKGENYAVFADAVTFSVDGNATQSAVTLTLKATKAGKVSEMLSVSSRITKAEAYPAFAEASAGKAGKLDIALRFNNGGVQTISGVGFELYQNQPNPFVNKTVIGFNLPTSTIATLTIYDETGRLIYTQKGDFAKGYNSFMLEKALLGTTGMLYYRVETATDSGVKQMIQVK